MSDPGSVAELIAQAALTPHFQPIAQLSDGLIFGHEALIRTPIGCRWPNPDELFAAARDENLSTALEIECVRLALQAWARAGLPGRLFLNLSARALMAALDQHSIEPMMARLNSAQVASESIVIELTEHEQVRDFDALAVAVARLRRHKVALALDDFGDGRSSLRLWSELKPEIVKIDKYFSRDLTLHAEKLQTLRALQQISQTLGSTLVAEGIETMADLHLVRDLGIRLGQGWALGRPQISPVPEIAADALAVIRSKDVAVFPERRRTTQQRASARTLLREVAAVPSSLCTQDLFDKFIAEPELDAACYGDLNHFKPFNDQYGYWRGDEMILLAARCIGAYADPRRDFVGHVGGDDFIVLFQSDDWERRCKAAITAFDLEARSLYDAAARSANGILAEDRHGDLRFHPLTTLGIGAVRVAAGGGGLRPEDVANAAALAKRQTKHLGAGLYLLDPSPAAAMPR